MAPPIHCGFKLNLESDEIKQQLAPYMGDLVEDLRWEIFTAVLFKDSNIKSWYQKRENKQYTAYIYKIYKNKKLAVAEISCDGAYEYITLVRENNTPLIQIKKMVSKGELGPAITVNPKIAVPCTAYME